MILSGNLLYISSFSSGSLPWVYVLSSSQKKKNSFIEGIYGMKIYVTKNELLTWSKKMEAMERNQRACFIEIMNIPPQPAENQETLCMIVRRIREQMTENNGLRNKRGLSPKDKTIK